MNYTINDLLDKVIQEKASDLHIVFDVPPMMRISDKLTPIEGINKLTSEEVESLIFTLINEEQKGMLLKDKELDFSFSFKSIGRFRANAFYQKGTLSLALRLIPFEIPSMEKLHLPDYLTEFNALPQGLILVTGPTGHGKSTTIASMLDDMNSKYKKNIITIEDPIEYIFQNKGCIIQQREMFQDTLSWDQALKSVLREDPNVVMIGEMRDFATISSALTVAETGHLVFATLHTNSAAQTIDRIIDVFPEHQQAQIRTQLSVVIEAVISQRLVVGKDGSRYPAIELMRGTSAVRNLIRESKTHQLDNVISTSADLGMVSLERSLAGLVDADLVSYEEAQLHTLKPNELARLIRKR
ncbi:MAG: type IV pilus twitching motility protein PilT [Candidatus Pacebacteria bacterium]|nr:type IV pilus twitching motility protein PilT [Candidatus Paceibacterota bacterium]